MGEFEGSSVEKTLAAKKEKCHRRYIRPRMPEHTRFGQTLVPFPPLNGNPCVPDEFADLLEREACRNSRSTQSVAKGLHMPALLDGNIDDAFHLKHLLAGNERSIIDNLPHVLP